MSSRRRRRRRRLDNDSTARSESLIDRNTLRAVGSLRASISNDENYSAARLSTFATYLSQDSVKSQSHYSQQDVFFSFCRISTLEFSDEFPSQIFKVCACLYRPNQFSSKRLYNLYSL